MPIPYLQPKDIRGRIMSLHGMNPFTLNSNSLITEKAGKEKHGTYTESAKSWLLNPLITYAVLIKEEAALFFQLKNVGHKLRNLKALT